MVMLHTCLLIFRLGQVLLHGWLGGLSYRCSLALAAGALFALATTVIAVAGSPAYVIPIVKATCLAVGAVSILFSLEIGFFPITPSSLVIHYISMYKIMI